MPDVKAFLVSAAAAVDLAVLAYRSVVIGRGPQGLQP
jgi:hypothetical protein